MSFKDLGLSEQTIHAIEDLGYLEPTTVQKDVIPSILAGKDIFTIAPIACGKTCSYIFPLVDVISRKEGQNILIIAADGKGAVNISDKFSIFNKYHEENETTLETDSAENAGNEANVIIASPDLLLENLQEERINISNTNILVVDDINLIKKHRQLNNLEKVLELLPADKQNIVFTTRRSKETQDILNKILKTPAEIKIDKTKESEVTEVARPLKKPEEPKEKPQKTKQSSVDKTIEIDKKAVELAKKCKVFGAKTPGFLLVNCKLATEADS